VIDEIPPIQVRDLIASRSLSVVFQPLVNLQSLEVYAYETLVRSKAFKTPPELIDAAIRQRCVGELGRHIRELATDGCPDHPIFVNVDPNEFDTEWLVRTDDPIFTHGHDVHLEITESVPLSHHQYCHRVLGEVRRRGARLAVDDLGAGYSNLKYISDLSPEIVKIDRELIKDLHKDGRLQTLVSAIVYLCERLGAKVVAEGIETPEEFRAVCDAGVHFGQGYFLARPGNPLPKIDVTALSEARAFGTTAGKPGRPTLVA
jgi:EAL domain-containing protein (putative c-di-GMP-specific phosphodiesterase class I)